MIQWPSLGSNRENRKRSLVSVAEIFMIAGVVAVVGTILFPVVAQARVRLIPDNMGTRYKPTRLRGLSQVASSVLQYAVDTDGTFPVGCGANFFQPNDGGWVYGIKPYLYDMQSLVAKGDPKSRDAWPDWVKGVSGATNISYASNGYMKAKDGSWGMYGLMGVDQSAASQRGGWMSRGNTRQFEVRHPEDTVMLAECYGAYALYGPSDVLSGLTWWDNVGIGGLIPDGTKSKEKLVTPYLVNGVVFNSDIRNGGMNAGKNLKSKQQVAFSDGHVKAMPPIATNPDPTAHPELNKWDIDH